MRIYLAAPYSHKDQSVVEKRVIMVNMVAGIIMEKGAQVFSPISHSHAIGKYTKHGSGVFSQEGLNFWMKQDLPFIQLWADLLIVLQLEGWDDSPGVKREIKEAEKCGIEVVYWGDKDLLNGLMQNALSELQTEKRV